MDVYFFCLLVDAIVRRGADCDMVSLYAHVIQKFLYGDACGGAASPNANDEMRSTASRVYLFCQFDGIKQQIISGNIGLFHKLHSSEIELGKGLAQLS